MVIQDQPLTTQHVMVGNELSAPAVAPARGGWRWSQLLPSARALLVLLLLCSALFRSVWLTKPEGSLIFDEAYYVNAARVILGLPVAAGAPYADQQPGRDPNREHPPLGKVLIAGSMRIFGDDAIGWRLPSVIAGTASVLLLYLIVRGLGGGAWLGLLGASLFAFDNLALVHSRIGSLDMLLVGFMLLGAWCTVRGWPLLGGAGFALAALTKLNGVYGLGAVLLLELVMGWWAWRSGERVWVHARRAGLVCLSFGALWVAGLWLLDAQFGAFATPWEHLQHILQFGLSLTRAGGPLNQESYPWQWLLNEVPMSYLRTDEQTVAGDQIVASTTTVFFRGAMNPFVIGAAPLGIAYSVWRALRCRDPLAMWAVLWLACTYLPFFPLALLQHRIMYIFYFLPTLPAVAVGLAVFVRESGVPRTVLWTYLAVVLFGFASYFPFRAMI
jgi:dolichyl-phosphate-mannose-protein mannosyltransferase